jgi:ribulose-phosphate 3-epimerase
MSIVVPAVLPASRQELEEKLELIAHIPSVSRVQIDVVDGRFASPASWPYSAPTEFKALVERGGAPSGVPVREMLPYLDRFEYEIDLMCLESEQAASAWLALGATRLTFHAESTNDLSRLLASAQEHYGGAGLASGLVSFGLALNIESDLVLIEQNLSKIGYVQFMGIAQIGRQGQPFDKRVLEKIRAFHDRHPEVPVQVDGGVSLENAKKLIALGVSNLVVGSAILRANDPHAVVSAFEALQSPFGV